MVRTHEHLLDRRGSVRAQRELGGLSVGDTDDVDGLESLGLGSGRRVAGQGQYRAAVAKGIGKRCDQVRGAGPRGSGAKAHTAGCGGEALGLEAGTLFVPGEQVAESAVAIGLGEGVVQRQAGAPGNTEDHVGAAEAQELRRELGPTDDLAVSGASVMAESPGAGEVAPHGRTGQYLVLLLELCHRLTPCRRTTKNPSLDRDGFAPAVPPSLARFSRLHEDSRAHSSGYVFIPTLG